MRLTCSKVKVGQKNYKVVVLLPFFQLQKFPEAILVK